MKKVKNKGSTKKILQKCYYIYKVSQDESGNWHVFTWGYPGCGLRVDPMTCKIQEKTYIELPIIDKVQHYKNVEDKTYKVVVTKYRGLQTYLPLSRTVYVYCIGEIPNGMQVDHIDNDPSNNNLDNLQLLSPSENMQKRTKDNPGIKINGSKPKKSTPREQKGDS